MLLTSLALEQVLGLDQTVLEASETLRWAPVTVLFVLASSWWVKAPVFVAVAAIGDLRSPRRLPVGAALAALVAMLAAMLAAGLKDVFERERPALADASFDPLIGTPGSPSFPSGHATTAFAAAALVATLYPRSRVPVFAVAALVALSRVYLGVHFLLDVIAGAALGITIGVVAARAARRALRLA